MSEIRGGAAENQIANWLSGAVWPYPREQPAVYTITANDAETAGRIANAFPVDRNLQQLGYALPRVNDRVNGATTLYVGSSEDVGPRLKQHLWQAPARTYALNLQRWCPEGDGFVTVKTQPILNNDNRQIRQDLEDAVWRELTPIYGKLGGR